MKKLFLLLLILPLAFVACSDDDDQTDGERLVGTWTLTKEYLKVTTEKDADNKLKKAIEEAYGLNEEVSYSLIYTFKADGTFVEDEGTTYEEKGTYSIKGNILTLKYVSDEYDSEAYILAFDGDNLLFISDYTKSDQEDFEEGYYGDVEDFGGAVIKEVLFVESYKKSK